MKLKQHSIYKKLILLRNVENSTRYYLLQVFKTLFDNYLLIREYGALKNRKPTGLIKMYFNTEKECEIELEKILRNKINKGYYMNKEIAL
ncbi:MAG: WGR domain-containing protein [Sulfurimonas sp.]|nr:WGR domain-containing protein [Sulfurimonas sp.]MDQ7062542.1 WGR domain-containing protein [Sulfurimonas sp.]